MSSQIFIIGRTGCGKSVLAEYLARTLGNRIVNHNHGLNEETNDGDIVCKQVEQNIPPGNIVFRSLGRDYRFSVEVPSLQH